MFFLFVGFSARAQTVISQQKTLSPFQVDSAYYLGDWVLPETVTILVDGDTLSTRSWVFNSREGILRFIDVTDKGEVSFNEVVVLYDELPLSIARTFQALKPIEVDSAFFSQGDSAGTGPISFPDQQRVSESNLRQSGSLSRGVIVGSNQDFSLESGLNFELSGALTENININASLTDQSIPIQPDGTTQNLREFDKVFIQVEAPNSTLEMGDVDVSLEQSTFAKLNRRLQGATGFHQTDRGEYEGAASVVRGTYKSMSFNGQEGVQGPYRLTGRNNEEFVIILAGTERVYINGLRVERGADNDYIIDYGLGEVTFTNNLLVKDETRILIEYEYIDQDFNRTLVAAEGGSNFLDGKLKIGATVIRQADGDDLLSQQTLTKSDIELLQDAGDDLENADVSGARIATPEERDRFVMYVEKDTLVNGEVITIYEHQPDSDEAIYRVQFSKVGDGEGSYRRVSGEVNGLLYEWVGEGMGSYEPFRQLPAPQKHQMAAINGSYKITDNVEVFGEWAVSDFDMNRFSNLDDDNNSGLAYESGVNINEASSFLGQVDARISRRYSGRRFEYFERTRAVEFDRKWGITRTGDSKEAINEAVVRVSPTANTTFGGELGTVERDQFTGIRQASSFSSNEEGRLFLNYRQDWVHSEDQLSKLDGNWFRQSGRLGKTFTSGDAVLTPYLAFEQEKRLQRNLETDSLTQLSQQFYDVGPGINLSFPKLELDASIAYRDEKGVYQNDLVDEATAFEQRYRVNFEPGANFRTLNEIRIRQKEFTPEFETQGNTNRRGLLLRSVTNYNTKNAVLEGELYYEANTERRALLQETFVEVGPEIGQYVWDDLNGDGTQQVDEFFLEVSPNEGTFIRQFLPSDDFFPVIDLNTRLLNTIKPFASIYENKWPGQIELRSRIDIQENSTTQQLEDVYLLRLHTFRNDSTTIQGRIYWEKELDILRGINDAGLRIGYSSNKALNQRSTESLQNQTNSLYLESDYSLTDRVRVSFSADKSTIRSISSRLQNRNYDVASLRFNPGINGTINRSWNAGLEVSFIEKEDRLPVEAVEARIFKILTTHSAFLWNRLQSNLRIEFRNTKINGNSSSYGIYELSEGTGVGRNLIWSLNTTYRVSNLVRFSFNYDGRTVTDRPLIHTIKLVMSATF